MSRILTLTDKFAPFLFEKKRFKVAFGGRAGLKSQTFADILLHKMDRYGVKVGCLREHQNSIEDSVHSLLKDEIDRFDLNGKFEVNKTTIEHKVNKGKFRFRGLAKNPEAVKSFNGFDIFWLEEAQFVSNSSLKMLTPTLRREDSECWLSFNPLSRLDPVSQRFILPYLDVLLRDGIYEDDLHYIVWSNFDENPWMPETLEAERQHDYKTLTREEYDHIWLGHFFDHVDDAIILAEWFDSCIDAHIKLGFKAEGIVKVAHDPSDSGVDDKGNVVRHGNVVLEAKLDKTSDINDGMDNALSLAIESGADLFTWDADGMGLGLKRQVKDYLDGEEIDYQIFRGSEGVDKPNELFQDRLNRTLTDKTKQRTNVQALLNKRAQYYMSLRNRVYLTHLAVTKREYRNTSPEHLISFSSGITALQQLRTELCKIPRKRGNTSKIQLMSKHDMKAKGIPSPNLADPVMMTERDSFVTKAARPISYANPWGGRR